MKNVLRALALTGILGLGAAAAQAQVRIAIGIPGAAVVAVPPCPGVGYIWAPGYYAGAMWVPGRWMYRGYDRDAYFRARGDWDRGYYRAYDRDDHYRDRDFRRGDHDGYRYHR